ncbi:hypothetical protein Drorol1_Dr00004184 [Drosera rotundifolia]
MPFITEAASAIRSRFGFVKDTSDPARGAAAAAVGSGHGSGSSENGIFQASENVVSEGGVGGGGATGFELPEDPSFWKYHNVQVIIRIRPLNSSEVSVQGNAKCVRQESNQTVTWTGHPESRFTFDLVADENVSQEKLFKVAGVPMVENCVGGYNSCMFAYGQTGSGKTHTMLGDIEGGTRRHSVNCGMTPRVFEYLFSRIQKEKEARRDEKLRFTCRCSFLEIYNEQILDLLNPSSINLQIREDLKKGVYVENLTELEVTSAREVMQQILQGAANRKVAATNMNHASSRSHSVFTCVIESTWETQGVNHHRFARLNLVDLAGSERQKSSGAEGERLKEATNINKSLSTLGLVIMNLVSISNGKTQHVPYRDSKLTFLLQDSLGGNSKTIIIANISPSSCCSLETLSTLKFAQRAKFIKNNAIVNEDASGDVLAMRMQIQQLKKEVARLRGSANGGAETHDSESLSVGFPASPGSFRWEGAQGSFSPFTFDRRTQKKEYEVALVGAFRREKDKDMALQALTAENQAAMQLAKQRADEIQGLKMRLRFREAGLKRLEAVAAGKISAEMYLLKEKEEHLKEIEVLRAQVDRNQEATRFAMENLRLNEEIRRLKSFYEEGERERMNEQITVLQSQLLEALDWKLMHEPEQKQSPGLLANVHSNSEKSSKVQESAWQASLDGENEFLRLQAIQNQAETVLLHKKLDVCMEEKQKLERHIKELETELQELKSTKPRAEMEKLRINMADESTNETGDVPFNHQMELKTMVDAIAAANEREVEAREIAVNLSKENDDLRLKLKVLIEFNNKLFELYEQATEGNSKSRVALDGNENPHDTKLSKVHDLEHQLGEMHEENEKLMGLYEKAMLERGELERSLSCYKDLEHQLAEIKEENGKLMSFHAKAMQERMQERDELGKSLSPNKNLEHQLAQMHEENGKLMSLYEKAMQDRDELVKSLSSFKDLECRLVELHDEKQKLITLHQETVQERDGLRTMLSSMQDLQQQLLKMEEENSRLMNLQANAKQENDELRNKLVKMEYLQHQVTEKHEENEKLMSLYEKTTHEFDHLRRMVSRMEDLECQLVENQEENKKLMDLYEKATLEANELQRSSEIRAKEELTLANFELGKAQEQLSNSAKALTEVEFLEKAVLHVDELSREIARRKDVIHLRKQELNSHGLLSSETREKQALVDRKLSALKCSLVNFSAPIDYYKQCEARARARVISSTSCLDQKRASLAHLQSEKHEVDIALKKIEEEEFNLRINVARLKSKLEEENQKQENEKVLFAIGNVERAEVNGTHKSWNKARELLKSEEDKIKLQNEMKHSKERLVNLKKQTEDLNKKSQRIESEIQVMDVKLQKALKTKEEMELALDRMIQERVILLEVGNDGMTRMNDMIVEYQLCAFEVYLRAEEAKILEDEIQTEQAGLNKSETEKAAVIKQMTKFFSDSRFSESLLAARMQSDLGDVHRSIMEAKALLQQAVEQ